MTTVMTRVTAARNPKPNEETPGTTMTGDWTDGRVRRTTRDGHTTSIVVLNVSVKSSVLASLKWLPMPKFSS